MAHPYKLTVPTSRGELEDFLGWMALAGPDFAGGLPGRDIDTAFDELSLGLRNVFEPGPSLDLFEAMSDELRRYFEGNDLKRAIELIDQMSMMVRDKTVH
jgi:hypothetical protein